MVGTLKQKAVKTTNTLLDPDGPELTAEQRAAMRTLQASLRAGLSAMYDEFSSKAGWRLRLKMPGRIAIPPLMLLAYCLLVLADSAVNFGQRVIDLQEEDERDLVLSLITTRQHFWVLFALRVLVTMPLLMIGGFGEPFNLVLRRYVELYESYAAVCKRFGDNPAVDWPHAVLMHVATREKMVKGALCMLTTFLVNAMAETLLDCVFNMVAIYFLANLDVWAENNVSNNAYSDVGRWLSQTEALAKYRYNPPRDAGKRLAEAPTAYAVECFLSFWSIEKVEASYS